MRPLFRKVRDKFALKISMSFCALIIIASFFLVYLYIQERKTERLNYMINDGKIIAQMLAHNSRIGVFTGSRAYLKIPVDGVIIQDDIIDVYVSGKHWESPFVKSRSNTNPDYKVFKTEFNKVLSKFKTKRKPQIKISDNKIDFWAPVVSTRQNDNSFYFTSLYREQKESEVVGAVKITMDRTHANKELKDFALKIIVIEILLIITGLAVIYLLVQKLTSPLVRLISEVEVVGKGGTPEIIKVESDDEIGRLAKSFNFMTKSLEERDRALNNINLELEQKIADRTRELVISTEKLEKEIEVRKNIEIILKTSEEKYRNIIESLDEGYFETTINGIITFSNSSFLSLIETEDKITGNHILKFVPEDEYEKVNSMFKKTCEKRLKIREVIRYKGSFFELSLSPVVDDKDIRGVRGFLQDVSKRLKEEENRKILAKKLQEVQRLESIGTLAGGIAHDFNNLLMGIQGNISLISIKSSDKEKVLKHIENIEDCVRRSSDLTRKLLGFAKGGKSSLKPVNLERTIKESVRIFAGTGKKIDIIENYTDNLWVVEADTSQIDQVLLNIFVNAYNAMNGEGTLKIETKNRIIDNDFIKPVDVKPGNFVQIKIKDNGCGMGETVKSRIFEPFYTTKPMGSESGKGMGLASVFGIIRKHGGFINVESTEGVGSSFNIFLPATDKKLNISATHDNTKNRYETLLLVDSEEMILEVGKPMLEEIGFKVITAKGSEEASEIFRCRKEEIDMIIMDSAPDNDKKVLNKFRKIDPFIKVLLSSSQKEDMADLYDGFIKKPFNMTMLSQKLSEIILDDKTNH